MKDKGITLLALIITVIVLLILATVSISLVINNNVLDKAQHGVDKYSEQEVKEKVELIIANYKLDIGNNKSFIEYLEEEKNINEIEDYKENGENTITIRLNNYDIVVNKEEYRIIDIVYNTEGFKKNRIIGEVYTTSTNSNGACVKVISYKDNVEKEFNHYTAIANPQEFSDFSVSYVQSEYKWYVNGKSVYIGYSTDNIADSPQYTFKNNISWRYTQTIHYYLIAIEENTYNIRYEMNGGEAKVPYVYHTDFEIGIPIPTKKRYLFTGWTGSNGSEPQLNVTIPKNSIGDKHFIANFTEIPVFSEVYTVSTGGGDANIKVIVYDENIEKEIDFRTTLSNLQEFAYFNISYIRLWTQ